MTTVREIVYTFFLLPYPVRMRILSKFQLLDGEERGLSDGEILHRAVVRAADSEKLEDLKNAIEKCSREGK